MDFDKQGINFLGGKGFAHLYKYKGKPAQALVDKEETTAVEEADPADVSNEETNIEAVDTGYGSPDYDFSNLATGDYVAKHSSTPAVVKTAIVPPEYTATEGFDLDWSNIGDRTQLFDSQLWNESRYGKLVDSPAGAKGPAQFMDKTWKWAQEMGWVEQGADVYDETSALKAQKGFMEHLWNSKIVQQGKTNEEKFRRLLASYNWGTGYLTDAIVAARASGNEDSWYTAPSTPTETKNYIKDIFDRTLKHRTGGYKSDYTWYT